MEAWFSASDTTTIRGLIRGRQRPRDITGREAEPASRRCRIGELGFEQVWRYVLPAMLRCRRCRPSARMASIIA